MSDQAVMPTFKCTWANCGSGAKDKKSLMKHITTKHVFPLIPPDTKFVRDAVFSEFKCEMQKATNGEQQAFTTCSYVRKQANYNAVYSHVDSHFPTHICTACPRAFPTKTELTHHRIAVHGPSKAGDVTYRCKQCKYGENVSQIGNVKAHAKAQHPDLPLDQVIETIVYQPPIQPTSQTAIPKAASQPATAAPARHGNALPYGEIQGGNSSNSSLKPGLGGPSQPQKRQLESQKDFDKRLKKWKEASQTHGHSDKHSEKRSAASAPSARKDKTPTRRDEHPSASTSRGTGSTTHSNDRRRQSPHQSTSRERGTTPHSRHHNEQLQHTSTAEKRNTSSSSKAPSEEEPALAWAKSIMNSPTTAGDDQFYWAKGILAAHAQQTRGNTPSPSPNPPLQSAEAAATLSTMPPSGSKTRDVPSSLSRGKSGSSDSHSHEHRHRAHAQQPRGNTPPPAAPNPLQRLAQNALTLSTIPPLTSNTAGKTTSSSGKGGSSDSHAHRRRDGTDPRAHRQHDRTKEPSASASAPKRKSPPSDSEYHRSSTTGSRTGKERQGDKKEKEKERRR